MIESKIQKLIMNFRKGFILLEGDIANGLEYGGSKSDPFGFGSLIHHPSSTDRFFKIDNQKTCLLFYKKQRSRDWEAPERLSIPQPLRGAEAPLFLKEKGENMGSELEHELLALNKNLIRQDYIHSFLLYALLAVTDRDSLQKVKEILEAQAATDEYQGLIVDALHDALRTFSLICDSDVPTDPCKLFRLILGGKKDL